MERFKQAIAYKIEFMEYSNFERQISLMKRVQLIEGFTNSAMSLEEPIVRLISQGTVWGGTENPPFSESLCTLDFSFSVDIEIELQS